MSRTYAARKEARLCVEHDVDAQLELCRTIDDAVEDVVKALEPLEQIKLILGDIEKAVRRLAATSS